MTSFRFPLQKVLDWRKMQLEMEEARFKERLAALAALDRERAELEASGVRAEIQVRQWNPVLGGDLAALASFRQRVKSQEQEIARRRVECERKLAEQQQAMLEARRRFRLLERLKDRKLAEWRATEDKELEQLAAESYLSLWNRELKA